LKNRAVRLRVMQASMSRNSHVGEFDNRPVVLAMAKKRAERANLLGYPSHAALMLEEQTAGTVEAVNKLMAEISPAAVANARKEAGELQKLVDADKGGFQIAAADWSFYAEKLRKARYSFDDSQMRPY